MSVTKRLNALVLTDGRSTTGSGQLVKQGDGLALVYHPVSGELANMAIPLEAPAVALTLSKAATLGWSHRLLARAVIASGDWLHGQLHVKELHQAAEGGGKPKPTAQPFTMPTLHPVSPTIRAAERPLFDSGVMLRRFRRTTPEGRTEIICSATDVQLVRRTLEPHYGEALRVYQSPWTSSEVEELDRALQGIDFHRVQAIEARVSEVGIVSRHLIVTFVDQALADELSSFPEGMLVVDALARPTTEQ